MSSTTEDTSAIYEEISHSEPENYINEYWFEKNIPKFTEDYRNCLINYHELKQDFQMILHYLSKTENNLAQSFGVLDYSRYLKYEFKKRGRKKSKTYSDRFNDTLHYCRQSDWHPNSAGLYTYDMYRNRRLYKCPECITMHNYNNTDDDDDETTLIPVSSFFE